jgi:DNA-damage-inducible protein D
MTVKNTPSTQHHASFESIRQTGQDGDEFWLARELAPLLDYPQWRNFLPVLAKAREACRTSGQAVADHFADLRKMVEIGSGAIREVEDVRLSRYACYLVVQNGDPFKPVIANGQTYFALQTRWQELADEQKFAQLSEDEKRWLAQMRGTVRPELVEGLFVIRQSRHEWYQTHQRVQA